jgi:hypothetical protein
VYGQPIRPSRELCADLRPKDPEQSSDAANASVPNTLAIVAYQHKLHGVEGMHEEREKE